HVDTYLYLPPTTGYGGDDPQGYGRWSAAAIFTPDPDEDPGSPEYTENSISVPGPQPSQVGVGGANAWYRADGPISSIWNHEFQHDLNAFGGSYGEMYSSIAQTITGAPGGTNPFDVPYTWSLLANTFSHGGNNYNAWQSLGAYVAFDFRG